MFELISAFGFLGTYQMATAVFSALRIKLIAVLLGPNGLGIFSQAKDFQLIGWFVVTLGLYDGIVNLVAEANAQEDRERQKRIVTTVSLIYVILGSLLLVFCWAFRYRFAEWVFGHEKYHDLIVFVAVSAFFLAQYRLMLDVFRGLLKWRLYATVAIVSYAIGIGISLVLIWLFGLRGAVFSLVITQLSGLIFGVFYSKLSKRLELVGSILPDWHVIKALSKYVGPLLGTQLVRLFTDLYIRRAIIIQLGASQSGIYHVLLAVTDVCFRAIMQPVTAYSMPKTATLLNDKKKIVEVQNNGIRLGLLGIFPIITLVYGLREIWIPLFFSNEFLAAGNLLLWWIIGDIFKALWVILDVDLIPLGRLSFIFLRALLYCGGMVLLTVPFMPYLGLEVIVTGYLIMNIIGFVVSFVYHLRSTAFRFNTDNLLLMVKASGMLTFVLWFSHVSEMNAVRLFVIGLILFVMFAGLLKSSERQFVFSFVQEKAKSILRFPGKEK
jgi:O-antigen/teichoic acid export membrane protein